MALGIAAPSSAHQFLAPERAATAIIGLQFAQDDDALDLVPQFRDEDDADDGKKKRENKKDD